MTASAAAAKSLQSCPTLWLHRWQPTRLPHPGESQGKNTGVGCYFLLQCMKVKSESEVTQSYLTLSDPMDCSPPGSSVHGIFQARVLEWGAALVMSNSLQPYIDCSPPGSSLHGILQARILEWVAMASSRGSSQPRDWTHVSYVSCIAGRFFTCWAIREALFCSSTNLINV